MNTIMICGSLTRILALAAMMILIAASVKAAPGELDPTFGNGGVVVTSFTGSPYIDFPCSIRIQPDGKAIVCGRISRYDPKSDDQIIVSFFIARYLPNGTLDMSFGTDGKIVAPIDSGDELVGEDIALQPDGKIVAVGYRLFAGSGGYFAVNRYNSDGTLDASFGMGGKVITQIGDDPCNRFANNACVNGVAVQPDGKIVVVGSATRDFAVVRYNPNGTLDTGFGNGGKIITHLLAYSRAEAVMIQPNGNILVAGSTHDGSGGYSGRFALVRYNKDGSLDLSFGVGGTVVQMFPSASAYLNDAVLQPDGRIVVAGTILSASTPQMAIIRYNANGSIDTRFASNGIFTSPNTIFGGDGIALQPDGKIVAFGSYPYARSAVLRLHPNGSRDTGFGPNGVASTNFLNGTSYGVAGAIQQNGGILFLGYTWTGGGDIVLARFLGDPVRPNGKIAFASDRDGNQEIYLMNADGTDQTRLTNNTIVDDHPVWSPNGKKLAFVSQRQSGGFAIFQMNIDGTNRVEITPLSQFVNSPPTGAVGFSMSWSPDGRMIAFQDPYYNDIWVVDVETHARQNLTNDGGGTIALFDHNPAWSPDGTTILYASPRYGGICPALYTIKPDGSGRRLVVPCQAYSPSWSPDGSKIVFVDLVDDFASELRIANSDGTNIRTFDGGYPEPGYRDYARWSPDGRKIAFSMTKSQDIEIYVKNVDGTGFAQLTDTPAGKNYRPSWEPFSKAAFDFDGDGRSDISVFRSSDSTWYLDRSADGFSAIQWGLSDDRPTPADFDGDGKTDIAVYRPNTSMWYWLSSSNGTLGAVQFGAGEDLPTPADYDGDGRADLSVFRSSTGTWYRLNSSNGQFAATQWGQPGDVPMLGDHDIDGKADLTVFRPSDGYWYIYRSSDDQIQANAFGSNGDIPLNGDFNGDGKADLAVFRPSNGTWYIARPTGIPSQNFDAIQFGIATDIPTPGDYDGDGKTDAAVFRHGVWYLLQSASGFAGIQFGLINDRPVPAAYLP